MRIAEVNKNHTILYLEQDGVLCRRYRILLESANPENGQQYLTFVDPEQKDAFGLLKILSARVSFDEQTGLLKSFDDHLDHNEWMFLHQLVKKEIGLA